MVSIDQELKAAKDALVTIEKLSIAGPLSEARIEILRYACRLAAHQMTTFSGESPLNEARHNVRDVLTPLIVQAPTQERIDKAKVAVDEWINQLRS
jgi:hypothetical protein